MTSLHESSLVTSALIYAALPPNDLISSTVLAPSVISEITMLAPSPANLIAATRPNPLAEPEIIVTLPANRVPIFVVITIRS